MLAIVYSLSYRLFVRSILPLASILFGALYLLKISGHISSQVQYILSTYFLLAIISAFWIRAISQFLHPTNLELILVRPISRPQILIAVILSNLLVAIGSGVLPWALGSWWTSTQQWLLTLSLFALSIWAGVLYLLFRREGVVALLILPWIMFISPSLTAFSSSDLYSRVLLLFFPSPYEVLFISQKSLSHLLTEELLTTGLGLLALSLLFLKRKELV